MIVTKPICLPCWRQQNLGEPPVPPRARTVAICWLCDKTTNHGLSVQLNTEPIHPQCSTVLTRIEKGTWPPDISLSYACPECGAEIDLRKADAI
jgi:hypothetical protein